MIVIFRLLWALVFTIMYLLIGLLFFIVTFKPISCIEVDTRELGFFKPIDTLGEHGLWRSHFHWALKIPKHGQ